MTPPMWRSLFRGIRRHWVAIRVPIAVVVVLAYGISVLIGEPLRRYTEEKMNRALKGYTARIKALDFHPLGFSLDLREVEITQDAHPEPAVLQVERLSASVHWLALLSGRLVGDVQLQRPTVYVNLPQVQREITDPTPVKERGWQEALQAVYPLKINHFEIRSGDLTYVDRGPFAPLRVRDLDLVATNIRNVRSQERTYPSEVRFSAAVFESGRISADGGADFLAEPSPTFQGDVKLQRIELDYFKPITNRYNLSVDKGLLSASGEVEYGQEMSAVVLRKAAIEGVRLEYVHTARTAIAEVERAEQVKATAKEVSNKPGLLFEIEELRVKKSTAGFVNKTTNPPYRVFATDLDVSLKNLSNHEARGPAAATLKGKFMGSGTAAAEATFTAEKSGPAFDVAVQIEDVSVLAMNDLLQAYGRFDAAAGRFSFYSELSAKDGAITGYVKPLFKDMTVYAAEQEKGKPLLRKVYERLVGAVARLLQNRARDEVATKAEISGRTDDPTLNIGEVVRRLLQNAFFKAILPGFDAESTRAEQIER